MPARVAPADVLASNGCAITRYGGTTVASHENLVPSIEGITSVLIALRDGEPGAFDQLVALVYPELRRIARRQLGRWRATGSLDTGSLVNEAYLKLVDQTRANWHDRDHFFAIAACAMRQVIIDYARRRQTQKRGGDVRQVPLDEHQIAVQAQVEHLLALDQLLTRLGAAEPRLKQVVECRFFAGYSDEETARVLRVSTRTVEREWLRAKAWLRAAAMPERSEPLPARHHESRGRS
jgi:RNA polymerase sigma factor (TIGR02999 family)